MEHWEFLIQKEGDRIWLPLESPEVEILEGRYRIVARSSRTDVPVEIRVTYQSLDEFPPKRRMQKRSTRTNAEGLMAVIPFTRLKPGIWDFRCVPMEATTPFIGQLSQHSVRVEVLPIDAEAAVELELDRLESLAEPDEAPETSILTTEPVEQPATEIAAQMDESAAAAPDPEAPATLDPVVREEPVEQPVTEIAAQMDESAVDAESEAPPTLDSGDRESEAIGDRPPPLSEPSEKVTPIQAPASNPSEPEQRPAASMGKLYQFPSPLTNQPVTLLGASASNDAVLPIPQKKEDIIAQYTEALARDWEDPDPKPEVSPRQSLPTLQSNWANLPSLHLTLERETYMVTWGEAFTLAGQIEAADGSEPLLQGGLEVRIRLQNPQTGELVVEIQQSVLEQRLPIRFAYLVEIPAECNTHLVLGEIRLWDPTGQGRATRSFTVTADLDNLLGAIATDLNEEDLLEHSREFIHQQNKEEIDSSFQEILETIQKSQPLSFKFSTKQFLPPQIIQPQDRPQVSKPLDLPTFPRSQPNKTESSRVKRSAEAEAPAAEEDIEARSPQSPLESEIESETQTPAIAEREIETVEEEGSDERESPPSAPESSPVDMAFQSLNLEERFFSRLNALAGDRELSEWLEINFSPPNSTSDSEAEGEEGVGDRDPEGEQPFDPEVTRRSPMDWEEQEIVVDDELLEPEAPDASRVAGGGIPSPDAKTSVSLLLPQDVPVPMPQIVLPKSELTAGQTMKVAVRLPQMVPRIYVKLWLNDRQNRTILDGPHWLTEFWPTGMGDVEGTRELKIPYGSLEVQVEAIAVEMQTQRESHKVSIERIVLPPRPPSLPLGD